MASFEHPRLPDDVVFGGILTKLSAKTLMRFSKSWLHRISCDSFFMDAHLNLHHSSIVIGQGAVRQRLTLLSDHCSKATEIDGSYFVAKNGSIDIVGSCNGLVCLTPYPSMWQPAQLLLWNPVTRQLRRLPRSLSKADSEKESGAVGLGFGFDATSNEYKAVMLMFDNPRGSYAELSVLRAQVFAKSGTDWRMGEASDIAGIPARMSAVMAEGALHWVLYKNGSPTCLLSFDLHDEVLHSCEAPGIKSNMDVRLCRWTGSLAAFTSVENGDCRLWTRTSSDTGLHWTPAVKFKLEIDGMFRWVWMKQFMILRATARGLMLSLVDPKTPHLVRNLKQPRSSDSILEVYDYIQSILSVF